jgi:hypothetical protein
MTRKPNFWKCIMGVVVLALLFIGTLAFTGAPRTRARNLIAKLSGSKAAAATSNITALPFATPTPLDVTTQFELEGNLKDDSNTFGEDWSKLNCENPYTGNATAHTGAVQDPAPKSIFTGGGSKDIYDINNKSTSGVVGSQDTSWLFTDGSVPDKDNITNAYAASYTVNNSGTPETLLYVGGDRFSNDGDAFIGAWFFQNPVFVASAGPDGVPGNADDVEFADGTFRSAADATSPLARHAFGDILVLANFPGGVATADAKVFKWVQTPGPDGTSGNSDDGKCTNDDTAFGGTTVGTCPIAGFDTHNKPISRCASTTLCDITPAVGAVKTAIGFANPAALTEATEGVCWPYTPKSGPTDQIPTNSFFEVGINLSALGLGGECFPAFALETRSSSSPSAQLKDFVLHAFQSCGSACDKTPHEQTVCEDAATPGFATATQTFEAENTGTIAIQVTLKDHQVFPDTSTNDTFITGKNGAGECTFGAATNITIPAQSSFTCNRTTSFARGTTTDKLTVTTVVPASGIPDCEQTATVTVNPNPTAAAGPDQTVCAAGATTPFTLAGSATFGTFAWSCLSGDCGKVVITTPGALNSGVVFTGTGSATLRLTTTSNTDPSCGTATDDVVLTVNPNPTAAAGPDQTDCSAGATTPFTLAGSASGGTTNWSCVSGNCAQVSITTPGALNSGVVFTGTGSATLRLTTTSTFNPSCGTATDDVVLTVDPNPTVTICGDEACSTDEVLALTANVTPGTGTITYSWTGPAGGITSDPTQKTINVVLPGTYTVNVTRKATGASDACPGTANTHVGLCPGGTCAP